MSSTDSKTVLITGCSQGGIGYGMCEAFAERGCKVFATARKLDSMKGLEKLGCQLVKLDVTSSESVEEAVEEVLKNPISEGRIDILINNAGAGGTGPLLDWEIEEVIKTYQVNVFGVMRLTKKVATHMANRGSGLIVVVGSINGNIPTPWAGIYASSKAAIHAWTNVLREEVRGLGINVILSAPGGVKSNFGDRQSASIPIPQDSFYKPFAKQVLRRAEIPQENGMPTKKFSNTMANQCLKTSPPEYISIGKMSTQFYLLSWLPSWLVMNIVGRVMGTNMVGKVKNVTEEDRNVTETSEAPN